MTQEELAGAIGVTVEFISNIEREVFGPKFDNLEKIANVLGIRVKELFYFDASRPNRVGIIGTHQTS